MGHLERRIEAEEARDRLRERLDSAEARLRGVLNSEPESATRAMMWMGRTEQAEKLLLELSNWLAQNASVEELLPPGFAVRVRAQLDSVESLRKAQIGLGERPPDDEWWEGVRGGGVRTTTPDLTSINPRPVGWAQIGLPDAPEEVTKLRVGDLGSQGQLNGGRLAFKGVPLRNDGWAEIDRVPLPDGREGVEVARLDVDSEGHTIVDVRRGYGPMRGLLSP